MNSSRTLNAEGKAMTMGELDKEAAAFWNKEVHPNTNPFPDVIVSEDVSFKEKMQTEMANARNSSLNWYEIIGWLNLLEIVY